MNYELLIVNFDDTDLNPEAAEDILRSVRIYLSHPRIVSIVAVDVETLTTTMTARNVARSSIAIKSLQEIEMAQALVDTEYSNAEAMLEKILPPALRYRLNANDMSRLNGIFRRGDGVNSIGPIGHHFEDWCRARFLYTRNEISAFVWWLISGPYRRLVADNIRRAVNFREATRDPSNQPLRAIGDYFQLNRFMHLIEGDFERIAVLIENGDLRSAWDLGDDEQAASHRQHEMSPYETDLVDLWVDVQIARTDLLAWKANVIRRYLPRTNILEQSEDSSLLPGPARKLGVAWIYDGSLLPNNCLYVYQLRRIWKVVRTPLPGPSRWVKTLREQVNAQTSPESAVATVLEFLRDVDTISASETAKTERTLDWLRIRIDRARGIGWGHRQAFDESVTTVALVVLYAVSRKTRNRKDFERNVKILAEPGSMSDFAGFRQRLCDATERAERDRQNALFTWACALEIGELGEDNEKLIRPEPRDELPISFRPSVYEPRLQILATKSIAVVERGGRPALLLQWSIGPLLKALHDYGTNYMRPIGTPTAWLDVSNTLSRAMTVPVLDQDEQDWRFPDFSAAALQAIQQSVQIAARSLNLELNPEAAAGTVVLKTKWPADSVEFLAGLLVTSRSWAKNLVN